MWKWYGLHHFPKRYRYHLPPRERRHFLSGLFVGKLLKCSWNNSNLKNCIVENLIIGHVWFSSHVLYHLHLEGPGEAGFHTSWHQARDRQPFTLSHTATGNLKSQKNVTPRANPRSHEENMQTPHRKGGIQTNRQAVAWALGGMVCCAGTHRPWHK